MMTYRSANKSHLFKCGQVRLESLLAVGYAIAVAEYLGARIVFRWSNGSSDRPCVLRTAYSYTIADATRSACDTIVSVGFAASGPGIVEPSATYSPSLTVCAPVVVLNTRP